MLSLDKGLELKDKFLAFAEDKEIKKEIKKEAEKEEIVEINGSFVEWFLFEKIYHAGSSVIDQFISQEHNQEEQWLVNSWKKFVFGIFKVKKEDKDNYILLNMINNHKYVVSKFSTKKQLKIGEHVIVRLIPFYETYLFTNVIITLAPNSNDELYALVAQFELDYPHSAFIDNQFKMEISYKIQALEYEDFVYFFGSDEIILEGDKIQDKLKEFYHYRYFQKKEKSTDKTISKIFREKYGTYPELPIIDLPKEILELGDVGVLYDRVEGLNFLPWYGIFIEIFKNENFQEIPGYKECVLNYLKSETISTLPFKKVLKKYPENTIVVLKDVLNKKKFELPEDFNKLMQKYKKSIILSSNEPSVIPMPERTKALLRSKKSEEFGSLHLFEGSNRYKDVFDICQNMVK
jgi:hypothetical protein